MTEKMRHAHAAAWRGPEVDYRREMMHRLTEAELAELDAALDACRDLDVPSITPERFSLPTLGPTLTAMRRRLFEGNGVLLLRGLRRERYTDDEMARIYVGVGSHLGVAVAQSYQGELLGGVIDISDIKQEIRGYNFGGGQNFHTDGTMCDIVALMCLRPARSGGASRIVSGLALHDALAERRPDLLAVLRNGYVYRYGEWDARDIPAPVQTEGPVPVFASAEDGVSVVQETSHIRNAVKAGGVTLSDAQTEAFNELQRLAKDPAFYLDMDFEPGDMQFLNNRVILHGRTDYQDAEAVAERRYLLRLWLHVPEWPPRPANQMFATAPVVNRWLERRRPMMDLPSRALAELMAMQEARRREGTLLAPVRSTIDAAAWATATEQRR